MPIILKVSTFEDFNAIYTFSIQQHAFVKDIFILNIDIFILINKYIIYLAKEI